MAELKKEEKPAKPVDAEAKPVDAEAKPVDAESLPRQDTVDAESLPRQKEDKTSSDGRGEDTASTGTRTDFASTGRGEDTASTEPDWKDLYARLRADFDNFKKRTARDREDTYRYAESDILKDILPTVDNLALALANAVDAKSVRVPPVDAESLPRQTKDATSTDGRGKDSASTGDSPSAAFVKGVQLVYDTLLKSLKDHGAEPFDSVGQVLDTERMEAIATLPSATVEEGKVSNEVKRGWMLKGKVLRVAQVVVSSGSQT